MKTTKLYVGGVEIPFMTCRHEDYVQQIGSFSAELDKAYDLDGLSTVVIEEDGLTVFQGMVEKPNREYSRSGAISMINGPEWTARMLHHYCPQDTTIDGESLEDALGTVLTNSPFGLGTVSDFNIALDPTIYDTALELLPFTFTDTCIVYTTTEEIMDVTGAGTYRLTLPNMRCTFYSKATGYFYILAYDTANSLLKYNSTNDGATWKGWTSLGFDIGVNGYYSITWDETNGRLFLVNDDGAGNVDFYRYSEAGGTLTQQDTDNNVATNATLVVGPALDDEGDVWFIAFDSVDVGNEWELWQFDYSTSTWTEEEDWDDADNNDPKFLFRGAESYATGDMIIMGYDGNNDDLEEWYWDESGGAIVFSDTDVIDSADMSGDNGIGYVCGYQDGYGNMFIIVEELVAAGGSYLTFSYRYVDDLDDYNTWEATETVVAVADHQSLGGFSLGGDNADNLYLYYLYDNAGEKDIYLARRFEGTWETAVNTGYDLDSTFVSAPEQGQAQYMVWENSDDDIAWMLLTPRGVCTTREFDFPYFSEDFDKSNNFNGTYENVGSATQSATNTDYPYSGTKNMKVTIPSNYTNIYSIYYKTLGSGGSFGDHVHVSAKKVRWSGELDVNGRGFMVLRVGDGIGSWTLCGVGVYRSGGVNYWAFFNFEDGIGVTWDVSATVANANTEYNIELMIYRDNANGYIKLYVDGALVHSDTSIDNSDSNYDPDYANFGLAYADAPSTELLAVYMDDCRISKRRIDEGKEYTGVFQSPVQTLTGSSWSTLQSTDVDIYNVSWDIEDDGAVDLVTGLALPVDLNEEAAVAEESDIVIEANFTQRGEDMSYIIDLSLAQNGTIISSYHDAENTYRGTEKLAEQLDAEFKLGYDDLLDFLNSLGEDKSENIVLFTSRSQSLFPNKEPTLTVVARNPDFGYYANCILVIGGTPEGEARIYATAKDTDEIAVMSERLGGNHNGEIWYVVRDPEILTASGAQSRANIEKAARSTIYETLSGTVINSDLVDGLVRGDTITLHDRWMELDQTARVMGIHVSYDGKGNKTVSLDLLKVARSSSLPKHVGSIKDLERYATQ